MKICEKCGQPHYEDPLYSVKLMWNETTRKHEVWINCAPYTTGINTEKEAEQLAKELRYSITFIRNDGSTEKPPEKCHLCETPLKKEWDAFRINDRNDAKFFHAKIDELVYVCPPCGKKAMTR